MQCFYYIKVDLADKVDQVHFVRSTLPKKRYGLVHSVWNLDSWGPTCTKFILWFENLVNEFQGSMDQGPLCRKVNFEGSTFTWKLFRLVHFVLNMIFMETLHKFKFIVVHLVGKSVLKVQIVSKFISTGPHCI